MTTPTIHRAVRATNGTGKDWWHGPALTVSQAAALRRMGNDIVVRGPDLAQNRATARLVELDAGGAEPALGEVHKSAGPHALPHWHAADRDPEGHTFYETPRRTSEAGD